MTKEQNEDGKKMPFAVVCWRNYKYDNNEWMLPPSMKVGTTLSHSTYMFIFLHEGQKSFQKKENKSKQKKFFRKVYWSEKGDGCRKEWGVARERNSFVLIQIGIRIFSDARMCHVWRWSSFARISFNKTIFIQMEWIKSNWVI